MTKKIVIHSNSYIIIYIIGSDNGLLLGRRQAIIWTNAGILFIGHLGTKLSETSHVEKSGPFCLGINVLNYQNDNTGRPNICTMALSMSIKWHYIAMLKCDLKKCEYIFPACSSVCKGLFMRNSCQCVFVTSTKSFQFQFDQRYIICNLNLYVWIALGNTLCC